jgi:hypothetical protein
VHQLDEPNDVGGLVEVSVKSGCERVLWTAARGCGNRWCQSAILRGQRTNAPHELVPIAVGHLDIRNDEIGAAVSEALPSRIPRFRRNHSGAASRKHELKQLPDVAMIVDDEQCSTR